MSHWRKLALAVLAAGSAFWLTVVPVGAQMDSAVYADVADNDYLSQIEDLAAAGILAGTECGPATFCPDEPVTRETTAVWLVRILEENEPPSVDNSRFSDVFGRWAGHVERLAELGITAGCGRQERFCPDRHVIRRHMAVFLARAYGLTPTTGAGIFDDVPKDDWAAGHIETAVSVGLLSGCNSDQSLYCPDQPLTRAEMAAILAQARRQQRLFRPPFNGPRQVYVGRDHQGSLWVRWRPPWHKGYLPLTKYIIQWRSGDQEFDESRQAEIDDIDKLWHAVDDADSDSLYAVRIMAVNAVGAGPASEPVEELSFDDRPFLPDDGPALFDEGEIEWLKVQRSRLWLHVEGELLPEHEQKHPWLRQAWNRVKRKGEWDFCRQEPCTISSGEVSFHCRASRSEGPLKECWLRRFGLRADKIKSDSLIVHELGHVLTMDNSFLDKNVSLAKAMLYFVDSAGGACPAHELYADTLEALVVGPGSSWYWQRCGHLPDNPTAEALTVVETALAGEVSEWFDHRYGRTAGRLDYRAIWADVAQLPERPRTAVVRSLRHQFGGYCDEAALADALEEDTSPARIVQPWRDGGCQSPP